jgi:hypothetical protein
MIGEKQREIIEAFRRGELTEEKLRQALEELSGGESKRQDLLYLQTDSTSLTSVAHGMSILKDGEISEGPADPEEWPYKTPLDAIRDGWRVIQFPNMALMLDESKTYGLGCEFILERWS